MQRVHECGRRRDEEGHRVKVTREFKEKVMAELLKRIDEFGDEHKQTIRRILVVKLCDVIRRRGAKL